MPPPFVLKMNRPVVNTNGSRWLVTEIREGKKKEVIDLFKERMKIDAAFVEEPDGIYVWIIKGDHLVTMPVTSAQEVGSVHVNMWSWTPELGTSPRDVSSAGELIKSGRTIRFNLKSGTFMKPILRQASIILVDEIAERVAATFIALGITATFLKCSPCTQDYETKSGTAIVDTADIVTPDLEMFFLDKLFKMRSHDPPTEKTWADMAEALGTQEAVGGKRRTRRQRRRHRAKNLTRYRGRKHQVRQKK